MGLGLHGVFVAVFADFYVSSHLQCDHSDSTLAMARAARSVVAAAALAAVVPTRQGPSLGSEQPTAGEGGRFLGALPQRAGLLAAVPYTRAGELRA